MKVWTREEVSAVATRPRRFGDRKTLVGDFRELDLSFLSLRGFEFSGKMDGVNLKGSNLGYAVLREVSMVDANLRRADLSGADLSGVTLTGSDLWGADLQASSLQGTNLRNCNLTEVDFTDAWMGSCLLEGAALPNFQLPQGVPLLGYKRLKGGDIACLYIPRHAMRTASLVGRKCRASEAIVMEGTGTSLINKDFPYEPGKTVKPETYDGNIRHECTHGIHFFRTEQEAKEYYEFN